MEGISASAKEIYAKNARLLLAKMVKVRRKASDLGQKSFVSTLNSFIRTVAQLLRAIGQSKFDKNKLGQILGMLTKKVEDMDAELDKENRTETTATEETETTTVGATSRPTLNSQGQLSNTDQTAYTRQAKSLIMECLKLRKKASQTGQEKYLVALNSYIKALARLMKQVREPTFDKKQVKDALILIKTKVSEIEMVLEQGISTESTSVPDNTVGLTAMSVGEVSKFIFLFITQCIYCKYWEIQVR